MSINHVTWDWFTHSYRSIEEGGFNVIDSIVKDGTVSHIQLTLSDYAQSPGYLILKSFAIKHATTKKNKVHVLCYEAGSRDLNLGPEVEVHLCFQDPLGWISGE